MSMTMTAGSTHAGLTTMSPCDPVVSLALVDPLQHHVVPGLHPYIGIGIARRRHVSELLHGLVVEVVDVGIAADTILLKPATDAGFIKGVRDMVSNALKGF